MALVSEVDPFAMWSTRQKPDDLRKWEFAFSRFLGQNPAFMILHRNFSSPRFCHE